MHVWITIAIWVATMGSGSITISTAEAQEVQQVQWSYRARLTFEGESMSVAGRRFDSSVVVSSADALMEKNRLTFGGGIVAAGGFDGNWRATAREAYARVSIAPWMDVEAGKRLIRWGVGYGYSPTGIIDPPRLAVDPTDRLGRQEGRTMVRADLFHKDAALTVALASDGLSAMRARALLPGGVEVAAIGAMESNGRASGGASFTHVVGQRLEWHGELMAGRTVSAVAGLQYTASGVNVVFEYHRRGAVSDAARPAHSVFVRAARAGQDLKIVPELIVIRSLDSRSTTTVAGMGWNLRTRLQLYARATVTTLRPAGSSDLRTNLVNAGAVIRF